MIDHAEILTAYGELKKKRPDVVLLFADEAEYTAIEKDAVALREALGSGVRVYYNPKKKTASFQRASLDELLPKMIRSGLRVAIIENDKYKQDK